MASPAFIRQLKLIMRPVSGGQMCFISWSHWHAWRPRPQVRNTVISRALLIPANKAQMHRSETIQKISEEPSWPVRTTNTFLLASLSQEKASSYLLSTGALFSNEYLLQKSAAPLTLSGRDPEARKLNARLLCLGETTHIQHLPLERVLRQRSPDLLVDLVPHPEPKYFFDSASFIVVTECSHQDSRAPCQCSRLTVCV
ncbi:hypothetical protein BC835DRAFT_1387589 [Cytidiella melzeri]|nr:hypothetical protein BC835DRAFT_1387589 [Cytidiella melzeri]